VKVSNFEDQADIEISNTDANPNSMFHTALPSLKLNSDNKLNNQQITIIQQQKSQLQQNLRKQETAEKANSSP